MSDIGDISPAHVSDSAGGAVATSSLEGFKTSLLIR